MAIPIGATRWMDLLIDDGEPVNLDTRVPITAREYADLLEADAIEFQGAGLQQMGSARNFGERGETNIYAPVWKVAMCVMAHEPEMAGGNPTGAFSDGTLKTEAQDAVLRAAADKETSQAALTLALSHGLATVKEWLSNLLSTPAPASSCPSPS